MGNCQASEAVTVVIVHPGKKVERIFRSVSAREIMDSNPNHYVALVVKSDNGSHPVKHTLLNGQVYRLISFQEFAANKCSKLGKLLEKKKKKDVATAPIPPSIKNSKAGGAWKPGLKSISETGN